jgi:hypothetical protein
MSIGTDFQTDSSAAFADLLEKVENIGKHTHGVYIHTYMHAYNIHTHIPVTTGIGLQTDPSA